MTEVETLYKNAGVKKYRLLDMNNKLGWKYPSFTTDKQIKLIKWIAVSYSEFETLEITYGLNDCYQISGCRIVSTFEFEFEQALASYINKLWKDLSDEDKQQIKEILQCLK